jgi:hypothetical protein
VKDLIGRLGLKCEPSGQFDRQVWAAKLAMLAEDVCHIPVDILAKAIDRHVSMSPYLPKASDINDAARKVTNNEPVTSLEDYAASLNAMNFSKALGYVWYVTEPDYSRGGVRELARREISKALA